MKGSRPTEPQTHGCDMVSPDMGKTWITLEWDYVCECCKRCKGCGMLLDDGVVEAYLAERAKDWK